ncbi:SMP-30/gluconolactonase/LRE family protein [Vreelandella sp. EE7]
MHIGNLSRWAEVGAELGESPVWDERTGTLYFVDITGGRLHAFEPGGGLQTRYTSSQPIGALALTETGDLIFAEGSRVALLDRQTRHVTRTSETVSTAPNHRFNDGACDPQGRFVSGLMDQDHASGSGRLYSFDERLTPTRIHEGMGLPNGLAWNRAGSLYFVDSVARRILQADYSPSTGALSNIATFAETPAHLGRPDGLAMDVEGGIWVCQFNGACLLRYDAYGELTDRLPAPVPRPTSCCFGGDDMKTLFVTSARFGMSAEELERYPESGDLFAVRLPVAGEPRYRFKAH